MKLRRFILLLSLLQNESVAQPASPVFQHLNTGDGLSGNHVKCSLQDQRGFMWFGTDAGLNRYDGKEFLAFKNDPDNASTVSGNEIRDLLQDDDGKIWIATADGGLSSYDYATAKFSRYPIHENNRNAALTGLTSIEIDSENNFWVGTEKKGLYLFNKSSGNFSLQSQTLDGNNKGRLTAAYGFFDIASGKNGNVYLGTLSYSLQIIHGQELITANHSNIYPFPAHTINCIFTDSKGRIWLGAWDNALHEYDPRANLISSIPLSKEDQLSYSGDELIFINEDDKGWLWIGTRRNGLFLFNPDTKEVLNFRKNLGDDGSLSSNTIHSIFRDPQNRMWLGTDAGIDVYDPLLHQFEIIYLKTIATGSADDEAVYDFLKDRQTLYVATSKGLLIKKDSERKWKR